MRDAHGGSAAGGWGDWVPLAALAIGGAVILSMVGCPKTVPTAVVAPAPIAAVQLPALLTAAPAGADVVESVVDGEPMVSIYFDTAKSDIYPTFAERTAALRAYATSHPADHLQVSGYNDPSGDPAMNAELSKNRAFAVRDALAALGISITTIALVRPSDTTENTESMAQARRVDVTVEDGPVPAEEVEPAAQ